MEIPDQLSTAVARLHGCSRAEQLAGARTLAACADRSYRDGAIPLAQHCVDALCAYLRVRRYPSWSRSELAGGEFAVHEQAEAAVREQIIGLLADFLRSGLGASRGAIQINLTRVRIRGRHVFDGVSFGPGLRLILDGVQLEEAAALAFAGCHFSGCVVRLNGVSLGEQAVLSLAGSAVDADAWLSVSTAWVHSTARVEVPGAVGPLDGRVLAVGTAVT